MACLFQCDLEENGIQRMKLLEKRNKKYLKGVKNWLQEKGLTDKTITRHINNTALFINDYLNYYDVFKEDYEEMCSSIKNNIDTILEEVYSFVSNDYDGMKW